MLLGVDVARGLAFAAVVVCVVTGAPPASAQIVNTPPAALNTDAGMDYDADDPPWITTDGVGVWMTIWESWEPNAGAGIGDDLDIVFSRSLDNGATWTPPAVLNGNATSDSEHDFFPRIATDRTGIGAVRRRACLVGGSGDDRRHGPARLAQAGTRR